MISYISGRHSYDRNILVETILPPPPAPDIAAVVVVDDQDRQHVVHMPESSLITFRNENYVHSASSSMRDANYNGDGVLYTSYARRLPDSSNCPTNT